MTARKTNPYWFLLLISGVLMQGLFTGCSTADINPPASPSIDPSPITEQPALPLYSPTISPTAVFAIEPLVTEEVVAEQKLLPTPASDPLRFSLPTARPAPISAWRPPLYPTPWAPTVYDHFFFGRPISANEINWPVADYRYGGIFLPEVVHTGIDIPASTGTAVLAAGSGRVTWAGYGLYRGEKDLTDPYGMAIAIKHDFGFQGETLYTVYGHLSRIEVLVGQYVKTGDQIGLVGETGKVTGPHLHFEVRMGRNNYFLSRNPELWLSPPQGWGVIAARVMDTTGEPLPSLDVKVIDRGTGQTWTVRTYGKGTVNSDPYYQENVVLGDMPEGDYTIWINFAGSTYNQDIRVTGGIVTYFTFKGKRGFRTDLPPTPGANFTPPAISAVPSASP